MASAALGVWLTSLRSLSRQLVPFAGGILVGVALFWVVPEMAGILGWLAATAWVASGVALIAGIDRFVYPICPACSHTHDHDHCREAALHGFAPPLLVAAALHAALDGGSASAAGAAHLAPELSVAIAIHKIPEGLALGVIVRAALNSRWAALGLVTLAELATLAGAAVESALAPHLSSHVLYGLLTVAGGSFLYLGGHAVHGEWRRRGTGAAFVPALTGIAGPSVLRLFRII